MAKLSKEDMEYIAVYDDSKYQKPSVTADIIIFSCPEGLTGPPKVLLIRRGGHPFKGCYAFPGGFAEKGETTDVTARRELLEETGVDADYLEQMRVYSRPGRDPRGWTITVAYLAIIRGAVPHVQSGDDAAASEWFEITKQEKRKDVWQIHLSGEEKRFTYEVYKQSQSSKTGQWPDFQENEDCPLAFDHGGILADALWRYLEEGYTSEI